MILISTFFNLCHITENVQWRALLYKLTIMKAIQHVYSPKLSVERKKSIVSRFFAWCQSQEEQRLLWLGVILGGHGCVITPITVLFVVMAGNLPIFWPFVIGAIFMSLIVNLAALPTKITLPVFFISLAIDLFVIINCIAIGLSAASVS